MCLAFCAERLADRRLIEGLDPLLEREWIGGYSTRDPNASGPNFHGALAEVALAGAAARCGSSHGARRLIAYLEDGHDILARFATGELQAVYGADHGRDVLAWSACMASAGAPTPTPVAGMDPVF